MGNLRIRIGVGMFAALAVSALIVHWNALLASVQTIRIPQFIVWHPTTYNGNASQTIPPNGTSMTFETLPSATPGIPTSTPSLVPTSSSLYPSTGMPTDGLIIPTTPLLPTAAPQPTKPPKATPTPAMPPVTTDVRPGTSIEEILRDVSKRMCIPYALLMAERMEEAGVYFNGMSAKTTQYYNTYGWWQNADKGEICYGLAYYTQTGIIPSDSTNAAGSGICPHAPFGGGDVDQKIMGLFQVGEDEQNTAMKSIKPVLPGKVDRRILFDNAVIFAIITKNRAGKSSTPSCTDWPKDTVTTVAEKHYGTCAYPGGNYCNEVWNYYQKYR